MDKDDNLFDDQIDDDDLLNISLDELSGDEIDGPVNEEPDEDIIELIDLLEQGDEDLLGIDDNMDDQTEDLTALSDDGTMDLSVSDIDIDDLLQDSDTPELGESSEPASVDELDRLFADDALGDLGLEPEESESTDNALEELLDASELEDLADAEGLDLQMEDILDESTEPSQEDASDNESLESTIVEGRDDLLGDLGLEEISDDDFLGADDEILDELDNELNKAIVSSDDESEEEALWEGDLQSETTDEEIDDIQLDDESLEDLLSENVMEESVENDSEIESTPELDTEDLVESYDEGLTASDEAPLMEESLEDLFSESDFEEETGDSGIDSEDIREPIIDEVQPDAVNEVSDAGDDALEDIETAEDLFSEIPEAEGSVPDEEGAVSDDFSAEMAEEVSTVEEISAPSDEDLIDETDTEIEPDAGESLSSVEEAVENIPSVAPPVPVISEEKVEEIVRNVVGEVVEKVAREVFTEVAERVITEAIDSLRKSLESDSE